MPSPPPFHSQERDRSCVPACLRMVLAAYGREFSEAELRPLCKYEEAEGTSPSEALQAVKQLGFSQSSLSHLDIDELQAALVSGLYPIAFVEIKAGIFFRGKHAVVVIAIANDKVKLLDPLMRREQDGRRELALEDFQRMWAAKGNQTLLVE